MLPDSGFNEAPTWAPGSAVQPDTKPRGRRETRGRAEPSAEGRRRAGAGSPAQRACSGGAGRHSLLRRSGKRQQPSPARRPGRELSAGRAPLASAQRLGLNRAGAREAGSRGVSAGPAPRRPGTKRREGRTPLGSSHEAPSAPGADAKVPVCERQTTQFNTGGGGVL